MAVSAWQRLGVQGRREARTFYVFISPWILGFLFFTLGPMIASLIISMTRWNMVGLPDWVGLGNYVDAAQDPLFWQALKVTAIYSIVSVPLGLALGLFVAVLMNQRIPAMNVFRTIYYLPAVVSGVSVAILWQ
ncbi:MAG: carbohydrate ABC transporter permease, partial [Anaerolineae bacterium]